MIALKRPVIPKFLQYLLMAFILYLLFILEPLSTRNFFFLSNQTWRCLILTCLMVWMLLEQQRPSMVTCFVLSVLAVFTVSTFLLHGNTYRLIALFLKVVPVCLLADLCFPRRAELLISTLGYLLGLYSIINLVTYFVYPEGMGAAQDWFIGYDNLAPSIFAIAAGCLIADDMLRKRKVNPFTLIVVGSALYFSFAEMLGAGIMMIAAALG